MGGLRTGMIVSVGLVLLGDAYIRYRSEIDALRVTHRREADIRVERAVHELHDTFHVLYEGLRTIARLPAVRAVGRHGEGLEGNTRVAVQELYNNLAGNVALSEVYLVPADFDPDRIDPVTGDLEVPITTFDSLIIGRTADTVHDAHEDEHEEHEAEEIEIYEYRLMREQLAWFAAQVPDERYVAGLAYPATSGREVVTCDNTRFSPSKPDDRDRSGLVFSVPFFRPDGRLGGMVSGVVLTLALGDVLRNAPVVLRNPTYDLTIGLERHPLRDTSAAAIVQVIPDEGLLYSTTVGLDVVDGRSTWTLWAGLPDAAFWDRPDVSAAWRSAMLHGALVLLGTLMALVILRSAAELRQRRLAEERAAIAEARTEVASLKTRFIAQASHDFRTPLAVIRASCDVLRRYTEKLTPTQRQERLDRIDDAVRMIDDLIEDVLVFGRAEAGRLDSRTEPTDVSALCEGVLDHVRSLASEAHDLILTMRTPATTARVDPKLLRRVLGNLLSNAVKYSPAGGPVGLDVDRADGALVFRVSDHGIGIPAADQAHLGELFHRGHNTGSIDGTGLGFAIARKAVEAQGGRIDITSEVGVGTTVVVTLPESDQPVPDDETRS